MTAYLDTNAGKNDKLFAMGLLHKDTTTFDNQERCELTIEFDRVVRYRSGTYDPRKQIEVNVLFRAHKRKREKIRVRLRYWRYIRGYVYTAVVPVPFKMFFRNGKYIFSIKGSTVASSGAIAKARSRVSGASKTPYKSARSAISTTQPVNPIVIFRPFLQVVDSTFGGFHQSITPQFVYYKEWSSVRTPGFNSLKRRQLPDNPYSMRQIVVTEDRYVKHSVQNGTGNFQSAVDTYLNRYSMPTPPSTLSQGASEALALKRLISNAGAGINANLAQNIAQMSQLSQLIVGNAGLIAKAMRQLKRGNISGAASTLTSGQTNSKWPGPKGNPSPSKSVASNWLQLQYGWKPLLSDIEGFFTSLGNLQGANDCVQRASSSATAKRTSSVALPLGGGDIGFKPGRTVFTVQTTTRFKIRFRVSNPGQQFLAQTGFTNPINLFWETLPFSFVVDWFLPIGGYLEQFSAWDGLTFLGGTKSYLTKTKGDSTISFGGVDPNGPTVITLMNASRSYEMTDYTRLPLGDFPSPVLPSFNSAGLQAGNRAANAIALVVSVFK